MPNISNPSIAWLILLVAGLLEVAWAIGLKYSDGLSKTGIAIFTVVTAWLSFYLLGMTLKALPVGTAYAVWTGIGAVGAAICGIWLFDEPATVARLSCIALIVGGILGLKLLSGE
ncbi:MAG TPA: multidrug efflux SMR transporter [Rhodocyclaceae bacterium]|nr:multidrug efflux SMR transporter [Rhodocyclaceae bacterium]